LAPAWPPSCPQSWAEKAAGDSPGHGSELLTQDNRFPERGLTPVHSQGRDRACSPAIRVLAAAVELSVASAPQDHFGAARGTGHGTCSRGRCSSNRHYLTLRAMLYPAGFAFPAESPYPGG
jgi:hypothetical protein